MMQKQILIVQDLGIKAEDLVSLAKDLSLPQQLIFPGTPFSSDAVEGLITINQKLGAEDLLKYPSLQFIAVAFTGYDSIDLDYCKERGIAVYNVPAYATNSVAELTLGTALSLLREVHKGNGAIQQNQWDLGRAGVELAGKKVGVVGTGRIGVRVAELFKAFDCEVYGWSRSRRSEFEAIGSYVEDLKSLFSLVDLVCLHLPLNDHTRGLVSKDLLEAMRPEAYLINMARGPVVCEKDLLDVLNRKRIGGAALDVFDQEPIDSSHPLCAMPNVLLTPHIAYKTHEALWRRAAITLENIAAFLKQDRTNRIV